MAADNGDVERRLWAVADQLRANSGLKPSEYSRPVLGLLFLRYADGRFAAAEKALQPRPGSRLGAPTPDAFKARGVIYLTPEARFSHLLQLPEGANLGRALNSAMDDIERNNPDLADALPKNYGAVGDDILRELIKTLAPLDIDGDAFGRVYEYFMGSFAMQEMQKGGEFYTPSSIVRLIVEIIEPYHGRILDPACGSGGMFVHSADFVRAHKRAPEKELSIFGIEKVARDAAPRADEPRRARPRRHDPRGQLLLRGAIPDRRPVRFRHGQSAVQRRRRRQGEGRDPQAQGPLSVRPAEARQRQLPLDRDVLVGAERNGPRRLRHGQFRGRRARHRTRHPQER